MVWCGTDGIISGVHPARQKRLVASLLILLATWLVTLGAVPQGGRRPPRPAGPPRVDKKKEAQKRPPLVVREEWTKTLPAPPRFPAAFDQAHAYLALEDGQVIAMSLENGKISWKSAVEAAGRPAAGNGLVFVPTAQSITALDAGSGQARWRVPIEKPLSAPLAWNNGWLLAGDVTGSALMLRAATGERLWQRALPAKITADVGMTGDRLYVPLDNGHVAALTLATGAPIWDRALGGRPTTLAPLDDRLFVGADDKFFYCLSWKNGKVAWKWRTGGAIVGRPAMDEDNVYFLSLDNVLRALGRGNGAQAWHTPVPFRPASGPVLDGRLLIVAGLSDIRAYQFIDGTEAGGTEVDGLLAGPPHFLAPAGDAASPFLIVTREGLVRLLAPVGPPLESKPFPAKPIWPVWPGEGAEAGKS